MNTHKLYMDSIEAGYLTEFSAQVIGVDDKSITLDQTLFYPLGGGQNWDVGTIEWEGGKALVSEVRGRGPIQHFVGEDHGISTGDKIEGKIDWDRRYAHMKMHTAQHLVSGLVYEMFDGTRTVGNQIHADRSRIDFNPVKFDQDMIDEIFEKTNELIQTNLVVSDSIMTRAQINEIMPPERTNMDLLPISVKQLRVVKIGDNLDLCPCAGTHVRNIGEIGTLEFIGKKNKGKGTTRISYSIE